MARLVAATAVLAGALWSGAPAQAGRRQAAAGDCFQLAEGAEIYGPTDVNAQTGNGGLSVGLNEAGTISVFKWPSPSYYDQVKYHTTSRSEPGMGAAANAGAFLGLVVTTANGAAVTWLRGWEHEQHQPGGLTDEVVTEYRDDGLGLTVTVRDVVAHPEDVLARHVEVSADEGSGVEQADLIAYENFSLVTSKIEAVPIQDWCLEEENADSAAFDEDADAIVHTKEGTDASTGQATSAAVAMGFGADSNGHQVGWDSEFIDANEFPDPQSADPLQDLADDGALTGNGEFTGETSAALAVPLDLAGGSATETLYFASAAGGADALVLLEEARQTGFESLLDAKNGWLDDLLAGAPMPATDEEEVLALAERALVTLVTDIDRDTNAVVASIATQSPYGEDWPRDGAFFDYTLDTIGLHDIVAEREQFYAEAQSTPDDPLPGVPAGHWAMNYYADGVVGGPIAWEIDQTGYVLWNFWEHYRASGDAEQLESVYPTVRLAADALAACIDEATGLQCVAHEDDNPQQTQSIVGAATTWMGLDAAASAAEVLGEDDDARRWADRRDELGAAIDEHLYEGGSYGGGSAPLIWPVCYEPGDPARMESHLEAAWEGTEPTFSAPSVDAPDRGQYEAKALLALAKYWKDDEARMEEVREGLRWLAGEHAQPGTHVMGEAWAVADGEVISVVSMPHAWEQVLFYLASLEAWPPDEVADADAGCDGVLGAIRYSGEPGVDAVDQDDSEEDRGGASGSATIIAILLLAAATAALLWVASRAVKHRVGRR